MARPGLRIKLLRRGRVVSDTPVSGGTVYAGHHWRCQIVDPHSRPARRKLLTAGWSGYVIHLPPDATGSFTLAGSTLSLEAMVSWGLARKGRKGYRVPIRGDMTAQIETEGSSLLLETVAIAEPERVLQPQSHGRVPVKYRLLMPDRTDMTFFLLLTLVFLLHVMAVRGLLRYPIPDVTTIGELPRRISRLILEPVAPPPSRVTRALEKAAPEAGEAPGVREKAEEAPPPSADEPAKAAGAEPPSSREEIRSRVSKMGVLGVLSGRGTAGRRKASAGISVLQLDTELQQDLEKVLSEVGGITTSAAGPDTGGGEGFGSAQPGSGLVDIERQIDSSGVSGNIQVSSIGEFAAGAGEQGTGVGSGEGAGTEEFVPAERREERSTRTISRIVAAHTGAIRYAYNRELRKNPSLRGKITLTFTISASGDVTECRVEESAMDWPPLEDSLVRMVRTWKFPAIPGGDVTVSYPLVFFPSM